MTTGPWRALRRLDTRDALLIAFVATFLVLAKAAMRWHLHVPGHAMFGTALLLVLVRGCVPRVLAASTAGLLAGLVTAALGMGKGGPLIVLRMLLPALVVDGAARLPGGRWPGLARGAFVGALAGATGFLPSSLVELAGGAATDVILMHALASAGGKALFGAAGGAAGAAITRRLREHGVIGSEAAGAGGPR